MVTLPAWQTARLEVVPVTAAHVDLHTALRASRDVQAEVGREPFADRTEAESFVQRLIDANEAGTGTCWTLIERASATPIGSAGIWRIDRAHDAGEIGYSLLPTWWGRGLAVEALVPIFDYGFGPLALHRIEASIGEANTRSAGVLRKLGFQPEARLRENYKMQGRYHDSLIHGLLASDWAAARPRLSATQ